MGFTKMALNEKTLSKRPCGRSTAREGLHFRRYFTDGRISPFDAVTWHRRTAQIGNEKGQVIFRQEDVEVPDSWSQTATNIVASKYFHGKMDTPERRCPWQLIGRVVNTIGLG
jgi:ribonucleoside-diphosphate reductase alpha chain